VTHSGAVENNLVERYLLSELEAPEREAFELHFFSCTECTSDLKDGALLIDGARPFLHSASPPRVEVPGRSQAPSRRMIARTSWWPVFLPRFAFPAVAVLSVAMAVGLGFQNRTVRQELAWYRQPRQIPEFTLLPATRGPIQSFAIPRGAREIQFSMDIASDRPFTSYRCEIHGARGTGSISIPLNIPKPGQPVQVSVPAPSADSDLLIRISGVAADASETEISSQSVRLHLQESP
jgi:hypothetical protein